MNINKLTFCNALEYIKRRTNMVHDIGDLYRKYDMPNDFYAENVHEDTTSFAFILSLLELLTNDKDHWIEWFVYENDFGRKQMECYDEHNKSFYINTTDDLYDFLCEESKK